MKEIVKLSKKKEWKKPELYILDSVETKILGSREGDFTTIPQGGGRYKFYQNHVYLASIGNKLSSLYS